MEFKLLRGTMLARDAGQADHARMQRWLPVVRQHGLDIGRQDSALLLVSAMCDTLRQQQAGPNKIVACASTPCSVIRGGGKA